MNVHCGLFRNLVFVQSVDAVPLSDDVLSLQTLRVLQGWRSGVEELGHKFSAGPRLQTQRVSGATWLRKRQLGDQNKQVRQTWTQNMCVCVFNVASQTDFHMKSITLHSKPPSKPISTRQSAFQSGTAADYYKSMSTMAEKTSVWENRKYDAACPGCALPLWGSSQHWHCENRRIMEMDD